VVDHVLLVHWLLSIIRAEHSLTSIGGASPPAQNPWHEAVLHEWLLLGQVTLHC